jgi:hypothetical protein
MLTLHATIHPLNVSEIQVWKYMAFQLPMLQQLQYIHPINYQQRKRKIEIHGQIKA